MAIVPKAYIGWCEEFQRDAPRYEIAGSSMNDGEGAWYVAKGEVIERYRENNVHGLVQRLWDMYFIQKPRSLMRFEDILRHVIRFRKVWLDAKMEGSN